MISVITFLLLFGVRVLLKMKALYCYYLLRSDFGTTNP